MLINTDILGFSLLGIAYAFISVVMAMALPNIGCAWKNFFFKVTASVLWPISLVGIMIQKNQSEET